MAFSSHKVKILDANGADISRHFSKIVVTVEVGAITEAVLTASNGEKITALLLSAESDENNLTFKVFVTNKIIDVTAIGDEYRRYEAING